MLKLRKKTWAFPQITLIYRLIILQSLMEDGMQLSRSRVKQTQMLSQS